MSEATRSCTVLFFGKVAGHLIESDEGYTFTYDINFLLDPNAMPISVTLPLRQDEYFSKELHPFFDGLIPEGWTLNIAVKNWKLDPRDRMGLLLACCADCIGAVSIINNISSKEDNNQ